MALLLGPFQRSRLVVKARFGDVVVPSRWSGRAPAIIATKAARRVGIRLCANVAAGAGTVAGASGGAGRDAFLALRRRLCDHRHYFVHVGNLLVLAAINQTDMLQLRGLSVVASCFGIAYNLLQPVPLVAPALWGAFFVSCHLYYISVLLRERSKIVLNADQERAYELAFQPAGFTPRQMLDIMEVAEARWGSFSKGAMIHTKGEPMDDISFLLDGQARLLSSTNDDLHLLDPGKGGWLGEFYDPNVDLEEYWNRPHNYPISFKCVAERCDTLMLKRRALQENLRANPRLADMATRSQVRDLWGKLHRSTHATRRLTYSSMLEVATCDGVVEPAERAMCAAFKQRHDISDQEHADFLAALGWTQEQFLAGRRPAPLASAPTTGR